jgi:DNA-binding beta-propeller fold protein YncE
LSNLSSFLVKVLGIAGIFALSFTPKSQALAPLTTVVSSGLNGPDGLVFDSSGNLYIANYGNNTISKVAAGSTTATSFITSGLDYPAGLAFDSSGNLYIANYANSTISEVAAGSTTATSIITSGLDGPDALAFDSSGNLYIANYNNNTVLEQSFAAVPFNFSPNLLGISALGSIWLLSRLRKWRKSSQVAS